MADDERIILEKSGDGESWRMRWEGADTERHMPKRYSPPTGGVEDVVPVYELDFGDDDAEGHGRFRSP